MVRYDDIIASTACIRCTAVRFFFHPFSVFFFSSLPSLFHISLFLLFLTSILAVFFSCSFHSSLVSFILGVISFVSFILCFVRRGVEQNLEKAFEMYEKAAELLDPQSMSFAAQLLMRGAGTPPKYEAAHRLFEKSPVRHTHMIRYALGCFVYMWLNTYLPRLRYACRG